MKRKILKLGSFWYVDKILFFCFFYTILTLSFLSFNFSYSSKFYNHLFENKLSLNDKNTDDEFNRIITSKISSDLIFHKVIANDKYNQSLVTQISLNREGKILGYKPTKIRLINYSLEKEIINVLIKNSSFNQNKISIYWLNVTNKY